MGKNTRLSYQEHTFYTQSNIPIEPTVFVLLSFLLPEYAWNYNIFKIDTFGTRILWL